MHTVNQFNYPQVANECNRHSTIICKEHLMCVIWQRQKDENKNYEGRNSAEKSIQLSRMHVLKNPNNTMQHRTIRV